MRQKCPHLEAYRYETNKKYDFENKTTVAKLKCEHKGMFFVLRIIY